MVRPRAQDLGWSSPWGLLARRLRRSRTAAVALAVLAPLYVLAALAGFLAPYHYAEQNRGVGWFGPMLPDLGFRHEGRWTGPFVHGFRLERDRYGRELAQRDLSLRHRVRWFVRGEPYRLLGVLGPWRTHLFGLDPLPMGAEQVVHALDLVRVPAGSSWRDSELPQIAAALTGLTGVRIEIDPDAGFQAYLADVVPPLSVDVSARTLREALDGILGAHRALDEGSRLAWQVRPEGVRLTLSSRVLEPRLYLLGCDALGRDLLSRILWGAQVSLTVGLVGTAITALLGLLLGGVAGYVGGLPDFLIMRVCDLLMAMPAFYLLIALRGTFPPDLSSAHSYLLLVMILALVSWGSFCRLIRGVVLSLRERDHVVAARALGGSHARCLLRHVLPGTLTTTIVYATLAIPYYVLGEVALSFLGLGVNEPQASWGNLLKAAEPVTALDQHPWVLLPGVFIFATVLAYNFLGDALRDAAEPRALDGR